MLEQSTLRIVLPIGFFASMIALLIFGESFDAVQATTIVVNGPTVKVRQLPVPKERMPSCTENTDCPLPTTYCNKDGRCAELSNPVCDCSQPLVLRCKESSDRARFMFCPVGCVTTSDGAICQ